MSWRDAVLAAIICVAAALAVFGGLYAALSLLGPR